MSYSLLSLGRDTRDQAMDGLRKAAEREEEIERANKKMKTAERTQTMGAMGTGAMIGFQVGGPIGGAIGAVGGLVLGELF
ncbi:bacteriocin [Photobacterium leiognathi subsp. mandapamensis]|uniref:bacteriocin n=1 Tax=Photobacterium leiognathi TaxID=553611 RepID=UPI003AF3C379